MTELYIQDINSLVALFMEYKVKQSKGVVYKISSTAFCVCITLIGPLMTADKIPPYQLKYLAK